MFCQKISKQDDQKRPKLNTTLVNKEIHYLIDVALFGEDDIHLFGNYKSFIENTIIELGEDWRIESALLSQEITDILHESNVDTFPNFKNENEGMNVFNQFLLPFLMDKIHQERKIVDIPESKTQDSSTAEILKHFSKNQKIISSLTFSTLSLGFCITASQIWHKVFRKLPQKLSKDVNLISLGVFHSQELQVPEIKKVTEKQSVGTFSIGRQNMDVRSCQLSQYRQLNKEVNQQASNQNQQKKWNISDLSYFTEKQLKCIKHTVRKSQSKKKLILDKFICNSFEFSLSDKKIRVISLKNRFYRTGFIVWLVFNIKLFFQLTFEQYLIYFKALSSQWIDKMEEPLHYFYDIIEIQWNKLLKDYSVALNDDLEVLNKLIDRVRTTTSKCWYDKSDKSNLIF